MTQRGRRHVTVAKSVSTALEKTRKTCARRAPREELNDSPGPLPPTRRACGFRAATHSRKLSRASRARVAGFLCIVFLAPQHRAGFEPRETARVVAQGLQSSGGYHARIIRFVVQTRGVLRRPWRSAQPTRRGPSGGTARTGRARPTFAPSQRARRTCSRRHSCLPRSTVWSRARSCSWTQ
jgi:hypothetical protein